jgi:3-isopropylmalate/(R)-2-methylmalate dehydratase small subunit
MANEINRLQIIKGKAWVFGDHINTDQIISTKYMLLTSKTEMAQYAFETIHKNFALQVKPGDLIVAGQNFGCGSAREQAPEVLKELKIGAIIAASFNMTFFRNSINIGIPTIVCPHAYDDAKNGDVISINIINGTLMNLTTNKQFKIEPFSEILQEILECSGLVNYYFKKIKEKHS